MWLIIIILSIVVAIGLYIHFNPQFGANILVSHKSIYKKSKFWDGEKFINQSVTTMDISLKTMPGLIKAQFTDRDKRSPEKNIDIIPFDKIKFAQNPETPKFIWYGHSVLLLQLNGKNYLMDPMFGDDSSPIGPMRTKRFSENALEIIDKLPPIEAVFMTHDHYDHLDYASIKKLQGKVDKYYVALGVSRHLEKWGVPAEQIKEFDWWDELEEDGLRIVFTPSRHFSGRGLFDRGKSLWGGWVIKWNEQSLYCSGDGGYDHHFKEIGEKYGPFDWAFVECGQYYKLWHQIHMYPEESIQAGLDAQAKVMIHIHWGSFALSLHSWKDPAERFTAEAKKKNANICLPQIGERIEMGQDYPNAEWYAELK
ncbi:MAG: hypothetical protein GQ527_10155 [Bacteroidales bacterium]|nr:hypothetical protein [Bacteroidales bacterium]